MFPKLTSLYKLGYLYNLKLFNLFLQNYFHQIVKYFCCSPLDSYLLISLMIMNTGYNTPTNVYNSTLGTMLMAKCFNKKMTKQNPNLYYCFILRKSLFFWENIETWSLGHTILKMIINSRELPTITITLWEYILHSFISSKDLGISW